MACAATGSNVLWIGADMSVRYYGAQDVDGSYLNAGTCTWTLLDSSETVVSTGTLDYLAASDGNYRGSIPNTVTENLAEDALYYLDIEFTQGGFDDFRRLQLRAAYRTTS